MERKSIGPGFKMKGHTLPGINQRSEGNTDLPDGRSASSAFQYKSPLTDHKPGHKLEVGSTQEVELEEGRLYTAGEGPSEGVTKSTGMVRLDRASDKAKKTDAWKKAYAAEKAKMIARIKASQE